MIFAFAAMFSISSGSSSFREVSLEKYFADEELPLTTKEFVRDWVDDLPKEENHVYALRFRYQVLEESKKKDYYYLIYIPGCGNVSSNSFGYSAGLFGLGGELKLELNGNGGEESFYCMMISEKRQAPGLRVIWNGKRLEDVVTVVDFNPTLYTIATEDDYSILVEASGDFYAEDAPEELKPVGIAIIKYENGQEMDAVKQEDSDFLLTTVVNIHELTAMSNPPQLPDKEEFANYFEIDINFVDATGNTSQMIDAEYYVVEQDGERYLIEEQHGYVYPIDEAAYTGLKELFD